MTNELTNTELMNELDKELEIACNEINEKIQAIANKKELSEDDLEEIIDLTIELKELMEQEAPLPIAWT